MSGRSRVGYFPIVIEVVGSVTESQFEKIVGVSPIVSKLA
jgi:hypothetical protein